MKHKFLFLLLFMMSGVSLFSQRNISKVNVLFGPFFKMYHVSQEMKLGDRISVETTVKARPPHSFHSGGLGVINTDSVPYDPFSSMRMFALGNVTEFRIYGKDKGALHGFYFGPYFSYTYFKLKSDPVPGKFHDSNGVEYDADVTQTVSIGITGVGLEIGVQGFIKNKVAFDWTILGVGLGVFKLKTNIDATNTSNNFDFRNYTDDINKATFGIEKIIPFNKTIDTTSVSMVARAPWPLIETGLSIGFAY
ncbi:MAG: hypothetical protein HY064_09365 [Bacteroidetes bacterium]|nr:hypothetical protein [Bacteroidota bacterium]